MRDTAHLTRRDALHASGIFALALGASGLSYGCARTNSTSQEIPESASAETQLVYNPSGKREDGSLVDESLKTTMEASSLEWPPCAAQCLEATEEYESATLHEKVNDTFYFRGWTDGLPIVPPTEERVLTMLEGTHFSPDAPMATLAPIGGIATVEKVAVNAVMAGCRPEYLPILLAATEAIAFPEFDLVGLSTTTGPATTMLILNGPVAQGIEANSEANALGRGNRANATIGRALHLIEQNVGGAWPGVSDLSSLGMPSDYSMMLAENVEANPWQPLHVERGFEENENVVTVASAESIILIVDIGVDGSGFLQRVAHAATARPHTQTSALLVLTPFTAAKLATEGWTKDTIRDFINKHTRVSEDDMNAMGMDSAWFNGTKSEESAGESSYPADENGMINLPFVTDLNIVVAGGVGEKNAFVPLWSPLVSRSFRLPKNFEELAEASRAPSKE